MIGLFFFLLLWTPLQVARRIGWWRWRIEGLEHLPPRPQGMVLAVNHISWLDILLIGASLPLSHRPWWIAKVELFEHPIAAWWFRQMRVIPIRRGRRDSQALAAAEDALRAGAVLIIFPEGHRSRDGQLQPGRGGAVRLAARSATPILPVGISGSETGLIGAMRRRPIRVSIGQPYHPEVPGDTIPFDRMTLLTDEMMVRIAELLPERYRGHYRDRALLGRAVAGDAGEAEALE